MLDRRAFLLRSAAIGAAAGASTALPAWAFDAAPQSGSAALDDTTCDLIIARFRFEPARDADGRPVESMIEENHRWIVE